MRKLILLLHYKGTAECDDLELRQDEINRIYDVFLPNEAYIELEDFIQDVYSSLPEKPITISALLRTIGEQLDTGILATAAKNDIPVYCPAFQLKSTNGEKAPGRPNEEAWEAMHFIR